MEKRRNALIAAARLCVLVDDIGWDFAETGGKSTAARLTAWPNKTGIISDWAEANVDVRHDDPLVAAMMAERVVRAVGEAAARAGCGGEIVERWQWGGADFRRTARRLGARSGSATGIFLRGSAKSGRT